MKSDAYPSFYKQPLPYMDHPTRPFLQENQTVVAKC